MEELQLSLTPARVDQRNSGIMLTNWRVGQVLNALVVNAHPNGNVLLSVGGKQFVATTDIPVQAGSQMRLEVKQLGQEVILRQVANQTAPEAVATARLAAAAQTSASTGMASLLNQLAGSNGKLASPQLNAIAQQLLGRTLPGDKLSSGDLRRAVRQSGLFSEADLAAGQTRQAGQSPKQSLSLLQQVALSMAQGADPEAPDLAALALLSERATAALNGIVNQQLASVPQDNSPPRWLVTLPFELGGEFHDVRLVIEQEPSHEGDVEQHAWRVSVHLDLPQLGAVDATVMLRGGAVSVSFACDEAGTSRRLGSSLSALSQRLENQEFRVQTLETEVVKATSESDQRESGLGSGSGSGIEVTA